MKYNRIRNLVIRLLTVADGQPVEEAPPRRNTKDELIDKIEKLSAEQGIPVEQSKAAGHAPNLL